MGFTQKQCFLRFSSVWIGHAAIDRTYRCALRFLVKSNTLCAFVGNYIIDIVGNRRPAFIGLVRLALSIGKMTPDARAVGIRPINPTLIDGVIGAFWLAGSAIDAFIGYDNGHPVLVFLTAQNSFSLQFNQPLLNKFEINL
jgi:hypothetical protein